MNPYPPPPSERGFTLAEMAVVLVIIALMLGGLLVPLSAQRDIEARRNTNRAMENIREALLGYAVVNGRLPCPAEADIASGAVNAGVEAYDHNTCLCDATGAAASGGTSCAGNGAVSGVLPWATLGLPETDGWNNRYTYLVTAAYARSVGQANSYCNTAPASPPANAAFALCTKGLPVVLSASAGVPLTTADEVPAIVVSHGDNGLGTWGSDGKQRAGAAADEAANADGNTTFVSNSSIDDILTWVSRPILMNRMIAAGKLP
jgi:prepilin-type N-terminal cleavage/methylation domain-containing protein